MDEDLDQQRPRSSWAQVGSTFTQIGLLGVAGYGLLISNAGERFIELLKGDIESAEVALESLDREKREAELLLNDQKRQLEQARYSTLAAQIELSEKNAAALRSEELATLANAELDQSNSKLAELDEALSVARPALMAQRCQALTNSLAPYVGLEMRYRLIPQYRWQRFANTSRSSAYESWATLHSEYSRWSDRSYDADKETESVFRTVDQRILSEIRDQEHWSQFGSERERQILAKLRIEEPEDFKPRVSDYFSDVRDYDDFLIRSLRLNERIDGIRRLLAQEPIERSDKDYHDFKSLLRSALEPHLPSYSLYVGEEEAMLAKSPDQIRNTVAKQLAYQSNANQARTKLANICYPNDQLKRFFLSVG